MRCQLVMNLVEHDGDEMGGWHEMPSLNPSGSEAGDRQEPRKETLEFLSLQLTLCKYVHT